MRTLIRGGWVVGWADGQHQVIRDGVCVVEDDRVLHVGKQFAGSVDTTVDAAGKLVAPGFISTHLHAGHNASDYVFLDVGRPEAMARNYMNWQAGVRGKPRRREDTRLAVLFGLGQRLRCGATTVVEVGAGGDPPRFVELVDQLGIRAYTGPSYRNVVLFSHDDGRLDYDWDDERGEKGLRAALAFAEQYDGAAGGRLKAMLCPGHTDTCSDTLLAQTAHLARAHDLPVTIHAAIHALEMERTLELYRETPIQLLARVGLLAPTVILSHVLFLAGHSWTRHVDAPDLRLLGEHGATVSHSPFKYFQMGVHLESLRRYVEAGVNVTIGTDFWPGDMLPEMRYTMLLSRVADRSFLSGTPRELFDAATVNAARALGRDDLGRLAPGANADVVVFDLRQPQFGAVYDPIKSLLEYGNGTDVDLVLVDGKLVVQNGKLTTVDEDALLTEVQAEGEALWADVPNWMWGGRSVDEIVPPAYPII
ncbi:MAG TPA: amidohydrolase family protein [Chloroflexota bacterium]|nr:amidohydrolase family protein [Chloroflexota bacterium]